MRFAKGGAHMRQFLNITVMVIGLVNIALFFVWLSIIRVTAITGEAAKQAYYFDQISFQISMLETGVTFMGIILAVLGFFGYQHAVDRAELRADAAARDVVARLHKDGALASGTGGAQGDIKTGLPSAANVQVGGAKKEGETI